jgi:predicted permease
MRRRPEEDLAREIRTHLELDAEDRISADVPDGEAWRAARRAFGNIARTQEEARAVWIPVWVDELQRDLSSAIAGLWRSRGFTLVAVVTLALGIGASVSMFSLIDQVVLRPLPVAAPGELVLFDGPGVFQGLTARAHAFSTPMFRGLQRDAGAVLSGLFARFSTPVTVSVDNAAERAIAEVVSGDYFGTLGVGATLGRVLGPGDDRVEGDPPVVVLSHAYWLRRFAANPAVINQPILVNGTPMTIAGVAAPAFSGFDLGSPVDLFMPLMMKRAATPTRDDLHNWRNRWLTVAGRLKADVSIEQAVAALNVSYRQLLAADIETSSITGEAARRQFLSKTLVAAPGGRGLSGLRDDFASVLQLLMGMVGLVLLIACANVANLLLARAASREREVAVRLALGAGRRRIVRQRLVEALILATAGTAVAIPLASWTTRLLIDILPFTGARLLSAAPDRRMLFFAILSAFVAALAAGLWPALHSTSPELSAALKEDMVSAPGGRRQSRLRRSAIVVQVGLAIVLVAGAGLCLRSLRALRSTSPGFVTADLLQFRLDLAAGGLRSEDAAGTAARIEARLALLPGVTGVAAAIMPALTGAASRQSIVVAGHHPASDDEMSVRVNTVGPGYFRTLGVPLVSGREFARADGSTAPKVAIVSERMARDFWPDGSAIGRRFGTAGNRTGTDFEVIGVVRDMRFTSLWDSESRFYYVPYTQASGLNSMTFYVRHRGASGDLATTVQRAVRAIEPTLPIYELTTVDTQLDRSLFIERLLASLSLLFSVLATALAATGLYGMLSFTIARRSREIGVRMALGATRLAVVAMILREVGLLVLAGAAIGLPIVVGFGRYLESRLFGVTATDGPTLAVAVLLLAAVAGLASAEPARRAAQVDPLVALRG